MRHGTSEPGYTGILVIVDLQSFCRHTVPGAVQSSKYIEGEGSGRIAVSREDDS